MRKYGNQLWIEQVEDGYLVGMTKGLQCDAGDISYANIASLGKIEVDETLVNLEASKAAIEVPSPVAGVVIERHEAAESNPSLLDASDAASHWLVKLAEVDEAAFAALADEEV